MNETSFRPTAVCLLSYQCTAEVQTTDTKENGMYVAEDAHKQDARKDDIVQQMNNKKLQFILVGGLVLLPSAPASAILSLLTKGICAGHVRIRRLAVVWVPRSI